jgi:hypothetical protein
VALFRPERKVTDPEGRIWEIYVTRATVFSRLRLTAPPRVVGIEAVSFFPARTAHRWTAPSDHVDTAVEQIARGLEAGELARPLGTNYTDPRIRPGQGPPSLDVDPAPPPADRD